jgi:type IV secretory pathway ATPase VirB11/archaellum biosynthesis ATPase
MTWKPRAMIWFTGDLPYWTGLCGTITTFIVASAEAASHKLVHPGILRNAVLEIDMSSRIDLDDFRAGL